MRLIVKKKILFLIAAAVFFQPVGAAQDIPRSDLVAVYLLGLVENIQWANQEEIDQYHIHLIDNNRKVEESLKNFSRNRKLHGKTVKVTRSGKVDVPKGAHIVYLAKDKVDSYSELFKIVEGQNILIISEGCDNKRLFMINLYETEKREIQFEINKANIINQNLGINPDIILLGGTEIDVAQLYKEGQKSLLEMEKAMKKLHQEQDELKAAGEQIRQQTETLRNEIEAKEGEKDSLQKKIGRQMEEVKLRTNELTSLKEEYRPLREEAAQLKSELRSQKNLLAGKTKELDSLTGKIAESRVELEKRQMQTKLQQAALTKREETITLQQRVMILLGLITFLVVTLFFIVIRSNRRQRAASKKLAKAKLEADRANQAKSSFLANMSHEIRTPMNAILGYSKLMQKENSLLPEQRESLNTITSSGEHLLALINDILEISKIEAKQITLNIVTFDFYALLHDLEAMFESSIETKDLQFKIVGTNEVPRYVVTDKDKFRQILLNLLSNAVKFTEKGGIIMRVTIKGEKPDNQSLVVEVKDTGVGITENELDKVFEYFEQTESGRKSKKGTGLGLAISRDFARKIGGDITVTSEVGKGSIFCLEINIKEGSESDIKEKTRERQVIVLEPGQEVFRILVVEDMEDSRILLVKILKTVGFQVKEAVNGKEAVAVFKEWRPHFIWMDVRMPVMDGMEATRRIKADGAGKSTVIAALTAHALTEEKEQILAAGCDAFVRKPFREQEIFDVMAEHLGIKYQYEEEPDEELPVETDVELHKVQLAALPADLRSELHQAVVELDTARTLELIEQVKQQDASIASVLNALAKKLDYRRLLRLLENKDRKSL